MRDEIRDACGVGFLADTHGRRGHHILPLALSALGRLAHRGAVDADGRTGDGAGVLTEIPWKVLGVPESDDLAVGMVFLHDPKRARRRLAILLATHGLIIERWRDVPVDPRVLGEKARSCRPEIVQVVVRASRPGAGSMLEAERIADESFSIASLSRRTIVYKALLRAVDLAAFYPDLRNREYQTAFALFHQRFSTNTLPSWSMTQPFRLLAHNGEINTIAGNRNWMRARGVPLAEGTSDSASLDEAISILKARGRGLTQAITMLMPPAWENDPHLDEASRAMFEYNAHLVEPWDGPALAVFADGDVAGAALDRNGLRPARYLLTSDGLLLVASEAGVLDVDPAEVVRRGRIGPGQMIAVDLKGGRLLESDEIRRDLASRHPYRTWLSPTREESGAERRGTDCPPPVQVLRAFGVTRDQLQLILGPMYLQAAEPLGSMGDDAPLAVLSTRTPSLFSYFKQRFAQVTNPPIDPYRESMVMSLDTHLGPSGDLFQDGPLAAPYLPLSDPILESTGLPLETRRLSLLFRTGGDLERALEALLAEAASAVRGGAACLVLTDRGVDAAHAAIPSLLAVSAVHQHLVRAGLRLSASIVAESGDARDDHQIAALIGFGADAVCPWLAFELAGDDESRRRYRTAIRKGLLKIMSKMGVSTLRSYRGAQLFEAVGIDDDLIARHFTGTPSRIGGIGLKEIAEDLLARHRAAFDPAAELEDSGAYRYRRNGEAHAYEPRVVRALQSLDYGKYAEIVHGREPLVIRDLLGFRAATAIPIEEVEPASSIVRRFMTAAMSLGAISPEAQKVLATAMNSLGARSNCGEGGEPAEHFHDKKINHRIKQIASARFGVTAAYIAAADELQIKIAQGSKPGEGGQLPGHKVTAEIATVRRTTPGITLISPPPHHDIYSIEDLAQLIYDLKRVNPLATVSVKLVSSAGIGTIAVGVAKAHADAIEISGHDGGTGASPLGSIKNAGTPWELGLAEAQQALMRAGLRGRVRLQVNGGLKTGRDVVIAAMFGAEEFGFGTAALVAAGCVMARQCHQNSCPAGIATQREDLRRKFKGTAENVVLFFTAIAEEVREILASLGCRSVDEIVGRSDLLEPRLPAAGKASRLRLDPILETAGEGARRHTTANDPPITGQRLDERVLRGKRRLSITNADRAVGARIAGELTRRPRLLRAQFRGSAGQSFGAFCVDGMSLILEGEANDGAGKGMSGGEIVIRPFARSNSVIAGNALLYGATGGRAFIAGQAGERFAVRNSGALAVVEGTGDHACEYMTGGAVVILGPSGRNLGAGMTGGIVFTLQAPRVHDESVIVEHDLSHLEEEWLGQIIDLHIEKSGSTFDRTFARFCRLLPRALAGIPQILPDPYAGIASSDRVEATLSVDVRSSLLATTSGEIPRPFRIGEQSVGDSRVFAALPPVSGARQAQMEGEASGIDARGALQRGAAGSRRVHLHGRDLRRASGQAEHAQQKNGKEERLV